MVNKFCPQCGKVLQEGEECTDCQTPDELNYEPPLVQVSEFNRHYHQGQWHRFNSIESVIEKRVWEALGKEVPLQIPPFEFDAKPKEKLKIEVIATINGEEVPLEVKLSYMQCDFGQKQKTGYYEGIMQLRNPTDEVMRFIEKEMKYLAPRGVFISKTVEQKQGVDLYFTNKSQMQLLGQKITQRFGGTAKAHAQLFSHNHQSSKDIYRVNILVELPEFTVKDVISFSYMRKGKLVVQLKQMGKLCQGIDLESGKMVGFELKNCEDIEIIPRHETTVSKVHPRIGVLDPETYQEVEPINESPHKVDIGQNVHIVKTEKGIFFVEK